MTTRYANEIGGVRLTGRQWWLTAALVLLVLWLTPLLWSHVEKFAPEADYRIPYQLSDDYWLYQRRVDAAQPSDSVYVLGDSVVWGEYVQANGTLSHFLNQRAGSDRFINAGVNGLFPLALEGLIAHQGGPIKNGKVVLHANLLWMSSPKADLSAEKEEKFNHSELVAQFTPRIPCYKADLDTRLGVVFRRQVPFFGWVEHIQDAYFEQRNILMWTLAVEEGLSPRFTNAYRWPLAEIDLKIPEEPAADPERGPSSPRHKAWGEAGTGTVRFEWVKLEESLQWGAFRRLVGLLRARGNQVFVLVGPFNEYILAEENRGAYQQRRDTLVKWLEQEGLAHLAPPALPSALYADASHPLTEGYAQLAEQLINAPEFQSFMK